MAYVIGVDVGGTFTDAVLDDDAGTVLAAKSASTPPDYSRGVIDVLELLAGQLGSSLPDMLADTHHIAHGTTSSLNALVTGNVPPVGFLTTKGHRDSIFIMNVEGRYLGRSPHELQNVLGQAKDHALLPKRHALEVTERVDRDGAVVVPLDEDQARAATTGSARSRYPCCGPSATRRTSGGCASWSPSRTRTCSSRCRARSARGSASSPATPPPS